MIVYYINLSRHIDIYLLYLSLSIYVSVNRESHCAWDALFFFLMSLSIRFLKLEDLQEFHCSVKKNQNLCSRLKV